MQFSFENKDNLENVFQSLLQQECLSSQSCPKNHETRLWHTLLGGGNTTPRITNSPITTSLSASPIIGIGQDEELMNTEVVENGNRLPIQDMIEMLLINKKEKNQNQKIQSQAEFLDALKNVDQDQLMENFKALGEMYYANKEGQKECNSGKENEQLATPMLTPIENVYLDESELPVSFGNKENDNSLIIPNTPAASVDYLNFALPTLDSTPINQLIPSPNGFSPIQPNVNAFDLIGRNVSTELPQLQTTPFEKPLDVMVNTPLLDHLPQESLIIAQDKLNPFKSPAPVVEPTAQLLAPSPVIANSLNVLLSQTPIQSPAISQLNSPDLSLIQDPTVAGLLGSISSNQSFGTPCIGSIDSSLLLNSSTAVQKPSPFIFPIASTPAIPSEQFNEELSSILKGNNLLSSNSEINEDESEVFNGNEEKDSNLEEKDSNLEQVDQFMKNLDDILKKNDLEEILKTLEKNGNENEVDNECECITSFPSKEMIKQCMVSELEFEFTNENITKLVHKAPVEVVQEDVIELEKLAKQKRGKGRPRKPRKYSICPFTGCGKKFNREFNLKEHIRIHNPKRNKEFVCQQCNEKFFSSSVLSRHIASIHQGEKFYCKNCGKKFNRKDALHRHEKISCHFSN